MNSKVRVMCQISVFVAIGLVLSLLENMLPPLLAFAPGAKMGLGNIVTLTSLVMLGYLPSLAVVVIKVLLASLFGGSLTMLMYSLPASIASYCVMSLLYALLCPKIGLVSVSVFGAIAFNIVQLFVASLVTGAISLFALLPLMAIASLIAGIFVGLVCYFIIKFLPKSVFKT